MKKFLKKHQRGFTILELAMVVAFIAGLAMLCGGVYVVIHFITKFW